MCGIIGYCGHRPAVPLVVEGLRRLEYRGYDSAGVSFVSGGALSVQVINNLGVEASASVSETTGADGTRQLQVTLEKAVSQVIASGKADGAMSRYGVRPVGRRTVS